MKKRFLCLIIAALMLLSGCAAKETRYEATFLTLFDTVTTIIGYAESKEEFTQLAQQIHDGLEEYHKLFDIYNSYEGTNNIKTINDNAGKSPVKVDKKIIDMLSFCKEMYTETNGAVNVCMGSVLSLWSEARKHGIENPENAALPTTQALLSASEHTNMDCLIINEQSSTVYITDPHMQLDVGAIAKGYAVQKVCDDLPEGILISAGGNVCATGPKHKKNKTWSIGLQDPDSESSEYLHTVSITDESVVSSGDYQRNYVVDGKLYHHIISPETLMPADRYRSVTVICNDSAYADALSTALFILSEEEGKIILAKYNAVAVWVYKDGAEHFSDGFSEYITD